MSDYVPGQHLKRMTLWAKPRTGCYPVLCSRSFLFNNHMIALQAAEDDVGAVLGGKGTCRGYFRAGGC